MVVACPARARCLAVRGQDDVTLASLPQPQPASQGGGGAPALPDTAWTLLPRPLYHHHHFLLFLHHCISPSPLLLSRALLNTPSTTSPSSCTCSCDFSNILHIPPLCFIAGRTFPSASCPLHLLFSIFFHRMYCISTFAGFHLLSPCITFLLFI